MMMRCGECGHAGRAGRGQEDSEDGAGPDSATTSGVKRTNLNKGY